MTKQTNNTTPVPVFVSWSSGKDSAWALHTLRQQPEGYDVRRLVCFVPTDNRQFYAHPTPLMELQARKIGIPIEFMPIAEPYRSSYRQQIRRLRDSGIEVLITGNISTVDGMLNWIDGVATNLVGVYKPLWELDAPFFKEPLQLKDIRVVDTAEYCYLTYEQAN